MTFVDGVLSKLDFIGEKRGQDHVPFARAVKRYFGKYYKYCRCRIGICFALT